MKQSKKRMFYRLLNHLRTRQQNGEYIPKELLKRMSKIDEL